MALAVADRVKETSTTAGTGTLTLLGAVSGYQSFSAVGSGNTTYYCIVDDNTGEWEVGVGTYTSPNQLSRDSVLSSSSGGSAITFLGNIKQVFVTYPAERSVYENAAGSLVLSKVEATTGIITNLTSTSATITNLSLTSLTLSNLNIASANITTLTSTNATAASLTVSTGNLTFSSTGQRITGDMSNATLTSRVYFQNSAANSPTVVGALPSGSGSTSAYSVFNASDPTNSSEGQLAVNGSTDIRLSSTIRGTGTYLPMTFYTGGSERLRLDASGNLLVGTSGQIARLGVVNPTGGYGLAIQGQATDGQSILSSMDRSGTVYTGNITFPEDGSILFGRLNTGSQTTRMTIDSSGNVGIGTASPAQKLDVAGTSRYAFNVGNAYTLQSSTNAAGSAFADDYKNALSHIWQTSGTQRMTIDSSGNVGIGGTADANAKVMITGTYPTSSNSSRAIRIAGTIPSGTTTNFIGVASIQSTEAASFTLSDLFHFYAIQGTKGAGSTITNQYGFHAQSSLTGATNNYGFYSDIASGSNRYNFFANGTADNYFAGNVGIGTNIPDEALVISRTTDPKLRFVDVGNLDAKVGIVGSTALGFECNGSERMRITSGGDFLVGCTANPSSSVVGVRLAKSATQGYGMSSTSSTSTVEHWYYYNPNGQVGSITTNASATAYNTSSDRRLKENIAPADDAGELVDAIQIVKHDWKVGGHTRYGVVAQDLYDVVPEAVAKGDDGDEIEKTWGVDYSKLVPILVKELQAVRARLAALEAK